MSVWHFFAVAGCTLMLEPRVETSVDLSKNNFLNCFNCDCVLFAYTVSLFVEAGFNTC